MKKCIACDEPIWNQATVCPHCWESLVPYTNEEGSLIIPEDNFQVGNMDWQNNVGYLKDFLPIFGWIITKEESLKMKNPEKIWSKISDDWHPEETVYFQTILTLKRKKSTVKPEIISMETDFLENLTWVSSNPFDRTSWLDIPLSLLFIVWVMQIYWDIELLGINYTILIIAILLIIFNVNYISEKSKTYEAKRKLSYKKFQKQLWVMKTYIRSDILDKYIVKK